MPGYQEKRIKRVLEAFEELNDAGRRDVLDKIRYGGVLQAIIDRHNTDTQTFGDGYLEAKNRQAYFNKFEGRGVGLAYFDEATMGFRGGEVTVIAGPSNVGKTLVALNIVAAAAERTLKRCLIISMEMTSNEIFSRLYNIGSDHEAMKERLFVQTTLKVDPENIIQIVQRIQPDLVMIDHLQFLANHVPGASEYERVGVAMEQVKRLAINQKIPIILISHVAKTRSGEGGSANNADLKGASNIEQDADIVIMLNRPKDTGFKGDNIICKLTKHRTKKPSIFLDACVVTLDGIKVADNGNYSLFT